MPSGARPLLTVNEIEAHYGRVRALHSVSLEVAEGGVVALLGANGAGKTTTLRVISGLLRPTRGSVEFDGRRIDGWSPDRVVRAGIVQVPEGRQIFAELTVRENLLLGGYARRDLGAARQDRPRVFEYFPRLRERLQQLAGTLSGGEQQMLAIGRALMATPRLLLLDEPSLGLAPMLVKDNTGVLGKEIWVSAVEQGDLNAAYGSFPGVQLSESDIREIKNLSAKEKRVRSFYCPECAA